MYRSIGITALATAMYFVTNMGRVGAAVPEDDQVKAVVAGNNQFALAAYDKLKNQPGNLFFSPYSISSALAMTYGGVRGNTAMEMAKALHFTPNDRIFHAAFGKLSADLNQAAKQETYQLSVANALWAQRGVSILGAYRELIGGSYNSTVRTADFQQDSEAARSEINAWVEKQTHSKIRDLLQPDSLTADTRLMLTNAIYFKSAWRAQFHEEATGNAPFTQVDGKQIQVRMMTNVSQYRYLRANGFQMLEIPYAGGHLSMIVLLPDKPDDLTILENNISAEKLAAWQQELENKQVKVSLPRFKIAQQFELKSLLSALGMASAFNRDLADFSGINGKRDLYLNEVVHKTIVDVNEEGTEAVAVTAAGVRVLSGVVLPRAPLEFNADHPFLFFIRHNQRGCILFLGRVTEPETATPAVYR